MQAQAKQRHAAALIYVQDRQRAGRCRSCRDALRTLCQEKSSHLALHFDVDVLQVPNLGLGLICVRHRHPHPAPAARLQAAAILGLSRDFRKSALEDLLLGPANQSVLCLLALAPWGTPGWDRGLSFALSVTYSSLLCRGRGNLQRKHAPAPLPLLMIGTALHWSMPTVWPPKCRSTLHLQG